MISSVYRFHTVKNTIQAQEIQFFFVITSFGFYCIQELVDLYRHFGNLTWN